MEYSSECTFGQKERVTSTYAEIYLDDDYCGYKAPNQYEESDKTGPTDRKDNILFDDDWVSPSDLLIGKLDLKPPFTSKITRGQTHEGILKIGDDILQKERDRFDKYIATLLYENNAAWNHILEHEKAAVIRKVENIFQTEFLRKSKIMATEINKFYEENLLDLEKHMKKEIQTVLTNAYAKITSDLNEQTKNKLNKEKLILENVLKKIYLSEVTKIKHYYRILLNNELQRSSELVNRAKHERNDALRAFYRQIDAENITATMYVMSTERKKCKIKKFLLDNYQDTELAEKYKKIKERQDVIDTLKENEKYISEINKEWEERIKKILQLFLKFLSFGLKLLPEQTSFLLDFEKMVVLQLNEIQKVPQKVSSILIDEVKYQNIFEFLQSDTKDDVCDKDPFVIVGDLSDPIPPRYGSRETLPSNVDLPIIRLQREFIYAKCHQYEEIKAFLDSQKCKCRIAPDIPSPASTSTKSVKTKTSDTDVTESESSFEPLLIDDIRILKECPARYCKDWTKRYTFPYLNSFLDFTEDNYSRVKDILGKPSKRNISPEMLDPKTITYRELPFAATKERYHHVDTQYSSQEDVYIPDSCPCTSDHGLVPQPESNDRIHAFDKIIMKRKVSMERLLEDNPNLLKMFTDESFDFIYHIK